MSPRSSAALGSGPPASSGRNSWVTELVSPPPSSVAASPPSVDSVSSDPVGSSSSSPQAAAPNRSSAAAVAASSRDRVRLTGSPFHRESGGPPRRSRQPEETAEQCLAASLWPASPLAAPSSPPQLRDRERRRSLPATNHDSEICNRITQQDRKSFV